MFMIRAAAVFGIVSICSVLAHGQWSPDPNLNLPVAVKTDVQVQPKVVSTVDGGCYVSWYDNDPTGDPPGGYDVFLQRFDAQGVPQWALDGIRLADLGLDYTTDYGLSVDASGNALLTFLDDRFGEYKQITAIKVDPTGAQVWGPNGIQLTNDATDKGNPKITPTSDGAIVVAWNSGKDIKLQRLDSSGGPQWIPPVTLTRMATMTYQLGDLHASNDGSVIISWVRFKSLVTAFHLLANKFSAAGLPQWGIGHLVLYDLDTLGQVNRPGFLPDDNGGAVFAWHDEADRVFAQHILSDGTEVFPHNGSLGTLAEGSHLNPDMAYDPSNDEIYMFWEESYSSTYGIYGQKFDSSGTRQWGKNGLPVQPLGKDETRDPIVAWLGGASTVSWTQGVLFSESKVLTVRVDPGGSVLCGPEATASAPSFKSSVVGAPAPESIMLLVWEDRRNDLNDIYAQNVRPDCWPGLPGPPQEVSPPGSEELLVFTDLETLVWEEKRMSRSAFFNLYRGSCDDLPGEDWGSCLDSGLPENSASDPDLPSPGEGFFYLITGENLYGEGPMGSTSEGAPRVAEFPCP